jgi:hypothetical protein
LRCSRGSDSNAVTQTLRLSASPSETLGLGAIDYFFDLDQPVYYCTPVSSLDFADEFNLYLDWSVNAQVTPSLAYGVAFPGKAAREVFGDGQPFQLLEPSVQLAF